MRLWIPGAKVLAAHKDATPQGGPRKAIWHTTENDPNTTSALTIAKYLNRIGSQVNLVWNPVTGEMVQMIPANRAGRGLQNYAGGVETNRGGSIVFQIEVVGQAKNPWTNGPCVGLKKITDFLEQLGIPEVWPAGDLEPYPASYGGSRSTAAWARSGHFGHSQVPENSHGDPGDINQAKVFTGTSVGSPGTSAPAPSVPKTQPRNLSRGDRGPFVVKVQKIVGADPDGKYGPDTEAKVKAWQKARGLKVDGVWGPQSEAAYKAGTKPTSSKPSAPVDHIKKNRFPLPRGHYYGVDNGKPESHSGKSTRGADDWWVKQIQKKVGVRADGDFGPDTEKAVIKWQKKNLKYIADKKANGKIGPNTWAAMQKV